jgi:hypothetical protein
MKYGMLAALLTLAIPGVTSAKGETTPLFASDDPIDVTIDGPVRSIVRNAQRSTEAYPATLSAAGETIAIQLAARGKSRRRPENCQFPPLSVRFTGARSAESLFDKQGRIKLVTHCRDGDRFEQNVLREYAAYRLYNVLTPESFKVRLARVRYLDDGGAVATKWGFFIEDADDAARRMGAKEVEGPDSDNAALVPTAAARYALFQYMIGNNDWDMTHGPAGDDCCHNSKLVGPATDARAGLTPVPYDFDYTGLVDAPYAVPPESLPIRNVRTRYYRGCAWRSDTLAAIPALRAARPALLAELAAIPGLDERTAKAMASYLDDFFEDLADPEKSLFRRCG